MTLNDLTDMDKAYLAGLIDGEGCISVDKVRNKQCKNGFSIKCNLRINMVDAEAIDYFHKKIGIGSVHRIIKGGNRRQQKLWSINSGSQVSAVLKEILPYLKIKVKQARNLLEFQKKQERGHRPTSREYDHQIHHYEISRELNKVGCEPLENEQVIGRFNLENAKIFTPTAIPQSSYAQLSLDGGHFK